jgi:hypothetical protein
LSLKKRKLLTTERPKKVTFKKSLKRRCFVKPRKSLRPPEHKSLKTCQNEKLSHPAKTLNPKDLSKPENVSSDDRNIGYNVGSYTQVRTAGDFLSSRKTARAERCTPKTTAAALAG